MRAITRYLSCVRPGIEVEGCFEKPKSFRAFLSDLFYFNFDVECGAMYTALSVTVFGFGFKLAVNDPLEFSIRLAAPSADVCLDVGLRFDWEKADLFREADDKRARFRRACEEATLMDITIDAAEWESQDARAERIKAVRREFHRKVWEGGDIDIGNSVFLVFKEDGVYAEVRPATPTAPLSMVREEGWQFEPPTEDDFNLAAQVEQACGVARHRDIGCDPECPGRG